MPPTSTITSVSCGTTAIARGGEVHAQLVLLANADDPAATSSRHGLDEVDEVTFERGARGASAGSRVGVASCAVPDPRMSSDHGRLVRGAAGWVLDDPRSKNGCVVNGARRGARVLADGDVIELGHTFFLFRERAAPPTRRRRPRRRRAARAPRRRSRRFAGRSRAASTRSRASRRPTVPVVAARRDRHRQGGRRARAPRRCRRARGAVRRGQLRRAARDAARERAVRPRAAARSPGATDDRAGPVRARRRRHPVPRRDRRAAAALAGRAPARARRSARSSPVGDDARRSRSTCASSPRPTATSTPMVDERRASARDLLRAPRRSSRSTLPPLRERRDDSRRCSSRALLARRAGGRARCASRRRRCARCCATTGRATCASSRSFWPAPRRSPRAAWSIWSTCRRRCATAGAWSRPGDAGTGTGAPRPRATRPPGGAVQRPRRQRARGRRGDGQAPPADLQVDQAAGDRCRRLPSRLIGTGSNPGLVCFDPEARRPCARGRGAGEERRGVYWSE